LTFDKLTLKITISSSFYRFIHQACFETVFLLLRLNFCWLFYFNGDTCFCLENSLFNLFFLKEGHFTFEFKKTFRPICTSL